jgi:hypothetical protein
MTMMSIATARRPTKRVIASELRPTVASQWRIRLALVELARGEQDKTAAVQHGRKAAQLLPRCEEHANLSPRAGQAHAGLVGDLHELGEYRDAESAARDRLHRVVELC